MHGPIKCPINVQLLGNGGIENRQDGLEKLGNLDGFLIGQATFGNPWCFLDNPNVDFTEKMPIILNHAKWLIETKGDHVGTREIRKHLLSYVKGFHKAKEFRSELCHVNSYEEIESIIKRIEVCYTEYKQTAPNKIKELVG